MSTNASIILVVEDDAIVRMLIVDVLEELEFKVLEADGCEQALELLKDKDQHIDLMMTDVGLPVMDGRDLANAARAVRPALPILFASGYAENIEVPTDMHVIGKPFSIDQLRDKVKGILGRASLIFAVVIMHASVFPPPFLLRQGHTRT
jgi:CheY-like chemotaxis protein